MFSNLQKFIHKYLSLLTAFGWLVVHLFLAASGVARVEEFLLMVSGIALIKFLLIVGFSLLDLIIA